MAHSPSIAVACAMTLAACAATDTTAPATLIVTAPIASASAPPILTSTTVDPKPLPTQQRAPNAPVQRDPARAEELFVEGKQAMARGDYAAACELFAESQTYDPADGTLSNLASCEEHIGELERAREHWKQVFANSAAAGRVDRASLARQRIDAIDRQLSGSP